MESLHDPSWTTNLTNLVILPWICMGIGVVLIMLCAWRFTSWFKDAHSHNAFPTTVVIISVTMCLFCLMIIPVDVYNISYVNGDAYLTNQLIVRYAYLAVYGTLALLAFVLVPFAYFYYEEERLDFEADTRLSTAIKYTIATLLALALIVAIVVIMAFSKENEEDLNTWFKHMLSSINRWQRVTSYLVGILACCGLLGWVTYAAFGLAYLPMLMMTRRLPTSVLVVDKQHEHAEVVEEIRGIESKLQLTGTRLTRSDRNRLEDLEMSKRILESQIRAIQRSQEDAVTRCQVPYILAIRVLGLFCGIGVVCIITSVFISALNCAIHPSTCSGKEGYVALAQYITNPLDSLLVIATRAFPMDIVVLVLVIFLVFSATLAALARVGVWFFCLRMYKFRRSATPPQGLLLVSMILIYITLAFSVSIVSLTPQYVAFGSQTYNDNTTAIGRACTMKDACLNGTCACRLSELATLVDTVELEFPIFGAAFFWSEWAFIAIFLGSCVFFLCSRESLSTLSYYAPDSDDESLAMVVDRQSNSEPAMLTASGRAWHE